MTSKYALIIANTDYQDTNFRKLNAPGKDAEGFSKVLYDSGFTSDAVKILLNEEDSKIRREISLFFKDRQKDDLLLLYFSCHGIRNDQGKLFLAVKNTEKDLLDATGISAEYVTNAMDKSRSKRQLLILDCCTSGAFSYGAKADQAIGQSMGISIAFEGDGYGRWVLTATDETQYAWDGEKVTGKTENSLYTHFLIEGLKGDADQDGDGIVTVNQLHEYARQKIKSYTDKQKPLKWSYKENGDITLRNNLKPRDVKPASIDENLLEKLSHSDRRIRKIGIEELITLLSNSNQGLVRAAQEKLSDVVEREDSKENEKIARDALKERGLNPDIIKREVDATKREMSGGFFDLWKALWIWLKIRKLAPKHPDADSKIKYLALELLTMPFASFRRLFKNSGWVYAYLVVGLLACITLFSIGGNRLQIPFLSSTSLPTITDVPTYTITPTISFTSTPSLSPTAAITPTFTPSLTPSPTPLPIVTTVSKCRSGPTVLDVESPVIVQIPQDGVIEIVGRNGQGDWLWISWIDKKTEKKYTCWISAILVDFTVDPTVVPTVLTPIPPTRVIVGPVGPDGQPVEIIQVIAPGQVSCSSGQDCGVSVNIVWENRVGNRMCVYVQPKEVPNQPYYLQFEGTSGTAWLGPAPDNTPFEIIAVSTTSTCGGGLPDGKSKSATVIRINN